MSSNKFLDLEVINMPVREQNILDGPLALTSPSHVSVLIYKIYRSAMDSLNVMYNNSHECRGILELSAQ
jgi:hypothetical protein